MRIMIKDAILENPEPHLYAVAFTLSMQQFLHGVQTAGELLDEFVRDLPSDEFGQPFVAAVLTRSGFGPADRVDVIRLPGHLQSLSAGILNQCGYRLPD